MNQDSATSTDIDTIASLDESDLLKLIFPHLPSTSSVVVGPGDDCAEVKAREQAFVVSTDILVEGVHFRTDWSTGYQTGWRAAMQNLADIAAMGAQPTSLVVGLAMPKNTKISWVTEFARGLGDAARSVGAACVGGDLSSAPSVFISVTVHGDPIHGSVLRSTAQEGDVVAIAGHTGWSAAGLELLLRGVESADLTGEWLQAAQLALQTYSAPTSPIALGEQAAAAGATAMMDISDGLVRDAQRIAQASGVGIMLDFSLLEELQQPPLANHLLSEAEGEHVFETSAQGLALVAKLLESEDGATGAVAAEHETGSVRKKVAQWLLTGGEDHGLLATFPGNSRVPDGFHVIGIVERLGSQRPAMYDSRNVQQPDTRLGAVRVVGIDIGDLRAGWDHFRKRSSSRYSPAKGSNFSTLSYLKPWRS